VRLEVWSDDERARRFYLGEYGHHLSEGKEEYRSSVRLRFNCQSRGDVNHLAAHSHKWLARWKYQIDFSPNQISIESSGNYFAIPMIHHMLVHPSLRYLAAQNGLMMLHAGGVSRNGKSILFSGKGGTGKTTTTAILLADAETGWQVHADDYVFLTTQPKSLAYMTRQHIYLPLLKWVPQLGKVMSLWERIGLFVFGNLRSWSREGLKWPVRIEPERAWPQNELCFSAKPAGLILLRRDDLSQASIRPVTDPNAALDELIEMNFSEARHFIQLVSAVQVDFGQRLIDWQALERSLLAEIIAQVPLYELIMPFTTKDFKAAQKEISNLLLSILNE